ncbi:hypothetical protein pb186bvf_015730 [Paramecium bursaria]
MLNDLLQVLQSNQSSEVYYNATQALMQFVGSPEVIRVMGRISENLGDQLPNLRKSSHQFFQLFIRQNGTFDPIFGAMMSRGIVSQNWIVRQKNVNSLQSLVISDGNFLNWSSHLMSSMMELLLNKLQDPSNVVAKATEQTLITFVQHPGFREYFLENPQEELKEFLIANKIDVPKTLGSPLKICPPLTQEDLEDINDSQWQIRSDAIQRIAQYKIQNYEPVLDKILILIHDHNFNIVMVTLEIILKAVQQIQRPNQHMLELSTRLSDPKQLVREKVRQILGIYLTRFQDRDLFMFTIQQLINKSTNNKEEVLDLITDLCNRNRMLLVNNLETTIKEIAPVLDDSKTKVKMKAMDVLQKIFEISPDHVRKLVQQYASKLYSDMFQEKINKPSPQKDSQIPFDISTASSNRSEMTLASRLRSKGEKIQQQETYIPTVMQPKPVQREQLEIKIEPRKQLKPVKQEEEEPVSVTKAQTYSKPFQKKQKIDPEKTNQPVYLEEIDPLDNPDFVLKNILTDLKYEEWSRQFDSLNNLRRLIKHQTEQLKRSPNFQQIILEVIKLSESLRSGVSKNALITLTELSEAYKRDLDSNLDSAYQKLIRKAQDASQFIAEEVQKCMITLIINCSEAKVISLAAQIYQSKSIHVKVNICNAFNALLAKGIESQQGFEKIVQYLCVYICDQAQEVRTIAKQGLLLIDLDKQSLDKLIQKVSPDADYRRIISILEKGAESTGYDFRKFGKQEIKTPEIRNRTPIDTMKNTNLKYQKTPAEFEQMGQHIINAETLKEWKQRLESVDWLCQLANKYPQQLVGYKFTNKFLDLLAKLINDANTKVAIHTCEQFLGIIEPLKVSIQNNATNVWLGIFQALTSGNLQIRQFAEQLFVELGSQLDVQYSIPQICHQILFGPVKSKASAINMLAGIHIFEQSDFIPSFYDDKPQLVVKHVIPLAKKLVDEQKPDIKQTSLKLFQQLHKTCPEDVTHLKLLK